MIYVYDNVNVSKQLIKEKEIDYNIKVTNKKWKEMINNEDLRLFKYKKKNIINELTKCESTVLRIGSWDSQELLKDYQMSNKIRHPNLLKYICYFEYEMDIIHYLCNEDNYPDDSMEELSVIIKPYLVPIKEIKLENEYCSFLKQIVITIFTLFFKYNTGFKTISFDNIYIKNYKKPKTILYDLGNIIFNITTTFVINIDEYRNMIKLENITSIGDRYEILDNNVKSVLQQFNKISKIQIHNIHNEITDKDSSVKMLNNFIQDIDKYT